MMPKNHYRVITNSGWALWWGLFSDYERDTQKMLDRMSSQGWDLHSFSLRNNMIPNAPIPAIVLRFLVRIATAGFFVYEYGGVWVFQKDLKESLSCMNNQDPTL